MVQSTIRYGIRFSITIHRNKTMFKKSVVANDLLWGTPACRITWCTEVQKGNIFVESIVFLYFVVSYLTENYQYITKFNWKEWK